MRHAGSLRRATILALTVAVSGVLATPALAYNSASYWNRSGTPLVVSGYGSTARGYGYIKIFNGSNGTRMYAYAWNKFTDADNHAAYLSAKTQYNAGTCRSESKTVLFKGVEVGSSTSCTQQFYDHGSFTQYGLNYTSSSWVQMSSANAAVHGGADRGRAAVTLKLDIPLKPDVVSGTSYSAADSW